MKLSKKKKLLLKLAQCEIISHGDEEQAHSEADDALLEYIGDKDIEEAFKSIRKWYA